MCRGRVAGAAGRRPDTSHPPRGCYLRTRIADLPSASGPVVPSLLSTVAGLRAMSWYLRRRRRRIASRTRRASPIAARDAVAAAASYRRRDTDRCDAAPGMERRMGRVERRACRRRSPVRLCRRARGGAGRRYATLRRMRATTADREQSATYTYLICLAAWAIPGAGHLPLGRLQKGLTFLIALTLMFGCGL